MRITIFTACVLTIISFATPFTHAIGPCTHDNNSLRCVKFVKNYDGDTITFLINRVHPILGENIGVRIRGIYTPEMKSSDPCEKEKAEVAQQVVNKILANGKRIDLHNIGRGKYFRIVADVEVDGLSVGDHLIRKHLAYRYDGGTKQPVNWCH